MYQGTLEPISNRADWFGTVELINDDTDEVITDLDGVTISIAIRKQGCCGHMLTAKTGDDRISIIGDGIIQWHFKPSDLRCLDCGTYEIGITVSRGDLTDQELIATFGVIDGVVHR